MKKKEKINEKEEKNKRFKYLDLSLQDLKEAIDSAKLRELLAAHVPDSEYDDTIKSIWEKIHHRVDSIDEVVRVAEVEFGYRFRPPRPEEKKKVGVLKGELIKRKGTRIFYGDARDKKFKHLDLSLWDLKELINVVDPVGLITAGASGDEYDVIVRDIWEKGYHTAISVDEVVQIAQTVFGRRFKPLRPEEKKKVGILKEELIKRKETKIDCRDATDKRFKQIDLSLWDLKKSIDTVDLMGVFNGGSPDRTYDIATEDVWRKTHSTADSIGEIVQVIIETVFNRQFQQLRPEEKERVEILKGELVRRKEVRISRLGSMEGKKFRYIDLTFRDLWESINAADPMKLFDGGADGRYNIAIKDVWEKTRHTAVSINEIVQITEAVLGYQFRPLRLDERKTVEVLKEELIKRKETKIDWDIGDKKFKRVALSLWDLKEAINTADPIGLLATGSHDGTYDVATENVWEKTRRTAVSINELVQATETAFGYWFRPLRLDEKKTLKVLKEELIKRKETKVYRKRMEKEFTYLGLKFRNLKDSINAAGFVELLAASDSDDNDGYESAIGDIWEKTHDTVTSIDEIVRVTETVFSQRFRPLRPEEKKKLEILKEKLVERIKNEPVYEDAKNEKFKHLDLSLWDLKKSIDTADFIELLATGAPDDEYDLATRDIWERTRRVSSSVDEVVQATEMVFGHWFWPLRSEEGERLEILREDLAKRIEENKRKK